MNEAVANNLIAVSVVAAILVLFWWVVFRHAKGRLDDLRGVPDLVTTKRNRTFPQELIRAARRVAQEENFPCLDPPLSVGEECQLLGGIGPIMMAVDADETTIIAAWDDGYQEHNFDRYILCRPVEYVEGRSKVFV